PPAAVIDFCVLRQPVPRRGEGVPVDRIVALQLPFSDQDDGLGLLPDAQAIEAAEALAECVEARALRDQHIEAEVGADLEALRRDENDRPLEGLLALSRCEESLPASNDPVAIEGPHPACHEDDIG